MYKYGLIGKSLTHSFSKKYFTEKFKRENITNSEYNLYELEKIEEIKELIEREPNLVGLNVTIPYKEKVIPYLDHLDESAKNIQAVNTIAITKSKEIIGFNTDVVGFQKSLNAFLEEKRQMKALILGTGGASKAVAEVLKQEKIPFQFVSREKGKAAITYEELDEKWIAEYKLIINTTPLGMYPKVEQKPEIPYQYLSEEHYLFDLIYNPELTLFLKEGLSHSCKTKNGMEMLTLQAEEAWEIWKNHR